MIDLKTLIQTAPFPADVKQQVLAQADSFSPEKKFEFENLCWSLISQEYQNKISAMTQQAMMEMAQGQKQYGKADFDKMEQDLFQEFIAKLNATNNQEQIDEVREKLQQVQATAPNQQ